MIPSAPFIRRPVATTLLTLAIFLVGAVSYGLLPVSPLPQVDFPTISVTARMPGASPENMAATIATPLERALGRIAGISEITSSSTLGNTRITLQFDLNRNIDGAARDVQAAINAARGLLPTGMPSNPTYRKVNPADAPIMIIGLTSDSLTRGQMYDAADTVISQKLLQIAGVGDVTVGGGAQPAVRVEANPLQLSRYGIGLETVRSVIANTNANRPKGYLVDGARLLQVQANDQAKTASAYLPLIVGYQNGAAVRLRDVAEVRDSVLDVRNAGLLGEQSAVMMIVFRQPGANIIATVDRVKAMLPQLQADIPAAIKMQLVMDRSPTIRASLADVERSLLISVALVITVVFLFLRNGRATAIPAITVPVSLVGAFAVMYLFDFSLDNLSLMALTVATGFVVDDTIVVLENISRHIENGMQPMEAAFKGAKEVGFTVVSMSLSLIAVFMPIMLMGGVVGRLFHEFAVTLSAAILVSLVVSLTTTPMLCSRWLRTQEPESRWRVLRWSERAVEQMQNLYQRTLAWVLQHSLVTAVMLLVVIALNVFLYVVVPKGFFPQQDTGMLVGMIQADQSISFQAMQGKLQTFIRQVGEDPSVDKAVGFTGGGQRNQANMFVVLKPIGERPDTADRVIARLRGKLAAQAGATLYLQAVQDIRVGGRSANAQYQYTLQGDNLDELRDWTPKVQQALTQIPILRDVNSDQQSKGLETKLVFDHDTMNRLGISQAEADAVLNDAFSQRQVSTIYNPMNQYHVVLEVASQFWQNPEGLQHIYVTNGANQPVPLSVFSRWMPSYTALSVNHQSQFASSTLSFNLPAGTALETATGLIDAAVGKIGLPSSIHGSFQGTARTFQESLNSMPFLILAALATVYIVLGMLYESVVHPVTILSTLPSAGVGALLALILFNAEFDVIALIGILLLIGIVKKNAIMMVDFAITAEREQHLSPRDAIYQACVLRFRPIMMTTLAALFGALPLALGHDNGAELRQPLGISIAGGLILSQLLTLYSTPVVYLYFDRFRLWARRRRAPKPSLTA